MGGWLNTSCIVVSIRAVASVRYREVVRSWEGPLLEVPLYTISLNKYTEAGRWERRGAATPITTFGRCSPLEIPKGKFKLKFAFSVLP